MNSRRGVVIYRCVLPAAVLGSVGLGFFWLSMQRPPSWLASLELATGALCCCIAGWVAGSTWTKACWTSLVDPTYPNLEPYAYHATKSLLRPSGR